MTVSAPLPLLAGQELPEFEAITPVQVEQAIPSLLETLNTELTDLETRLQHRLAEQDKPLTWDELMDPLHRLG